MLLSNKENMIKIGILVSYDYELIKHVIPTVYDEADLICLAIDKNRQTWAGEHFDIDKSWFDWIKTYDIQNKIKLYEDTFYQDNLSTMECETRERNSLAKFMGDGGWHIQIDADEYFIDFPSFVKFLRKTKTPDTQIEAEWVTIFKTTSDGMFLIDSNERFPIATNNPKYIHARVTNCRKRKKTQFKVLHQSWGRTKDELQKKLHNWGHKNDFNTKSYLNIWEAIDKDNYQYLRNFHPINADAWEKLIFSEGTDIQDIINQRREEYFRKQKKYFHFLKRRK